LPTAPTLPLKYGDYGPTDAIDPADIAASQQAIPRYHSITSSSARATSIGICGFTSS